MSRDETRPRLACGARARMRARRALRATASGLLLAAAAAAGAATAPPANVA